MAIYRNISMNFWTDTKIVDEFSPEDKYFMLYCLTNQYTNLCGCYEISIKQMTRDTGYNEETIMKLLDRFNSKYGVIEYNKENKELYIKNWFKYNWTKSEKLDKPLLEEIKSIKTVDFKEKLIEIYNKRDTVSIPYIYPMHTTVSDTVYNNINNNTNNKKERNIKERKIFKKPTLEEIENYIKEKNMNVNAKTFYDYFETSNWVDSKGNKVKNWKLKIITWNSYGKDKKEEPVWFDKNIKNQEITESEKKELENLLNDM